MHVIELLVTLYKEGDAWLKGLRTTDWRKQDIERLFSECRLIRFSSADDVRTTLNLRARGLVGRSEKALVLRPWEKGGDILVVLQPIFGRRPDGLAGKMSFCVGVMTDNSKGFFGYRYEGPEGGPSHNFYHIQPIGGFGGARMQCAVEWYPDKWPSFPVYVKNNCELLLAVMLSMQGIDKVQREANQTRPEVRKHAQSLIAQLKPAA
jgi:hypothetical protein